MAIGEGFVKTVAFIGTPVPDKRLVGTAFSLRFRLRSTREPNTTSRCSSVDTVTAVTTRWRDDVSDAYAGRVLQERAASGAQLPA
jgi:hypothetical protein